MAPILLPRSAWDPSPSSGLFSTFLTPSRIKGCVLHYPGDSIHERKDFSQEQVASLIRAWDRHHRIYRGWPGLGYPLIVDQAGRIWDGAGPRVAAHSATNAYPGANRDFYAIVCVLGNNERPTHDMAQSIGWVRSKVLRGELLLGDWTGRQFAGAKTLLGHRNIMGAATLCPGDQVIEGINQGRFNFVDDVIGVEPKPGTGSPYEPGVILAAKRILAYAGYYGGAIDDRYEPWFIASTRHYQFSQRWPSLEPDGFWGPKTNGHAEWVGTLQATLNQWKTALPPLRVDKDYRDLTFRRVWEVQERNHGGAYPIWAKVDGIAGSVTCQMLNIPAHPWAK